MIILELFVMILIILYKPLGGFIATEDIKGLKQYHSGLLEDCQKLNDLTVLSPEVLNNPRST